MKYSYSFIIPHKNTPNLLAKCLKSIPERDDVQVIIVDDNSDPNKVDFKHFPGTGRKNFVVVFDKSGKGAGNARNVALDQVEDTKWLVFSDSDDYFTPYLSEAMDTYRHSDYDMVYFKRHSVYVGTNNPATRHQKANSRVDYALSTRDYNIIRYKDLAPVCKFVSYKLVKENNIRFESIPMSNDAMFFLNVGCRANSIKIDANPIYIVSEREGSLMKIYNRESIECRYYTSTRVIALQKQYGVEKYHPNLFAYLYAFSKIKKSLVIKYFFKSLKFTPMKYWFMDLYVCFQEFRKGNNKQV